MRKLFLLLGAAAIAFGASAQTELQAQKGSPRHGFKRAAATYTEPEPAPGYIIFGYCDGLYTGLGVNQGSEVQAAIRMPQDRATQLKGNQLTKVRIGYGTTESTDITIYLSYDAQKADQTFYKQDVTVTKQNDWNEFTLETPYEIEGKEFYICYSVPVKGKNFYPIGVDYVPTKNQNGGWIALGNSWQNIAELYGSVCIQGVIEGESLPRNDLAVSECYFPPTVKMNAEFPISMWVQNNGAESVSSASVSVTVGNQEFANLPGILTPAYIAPGEFGQLDVAGVYCATEGANIEYSAKVSQVDGVDNASVAPPATGTFTCLENGFQRNVVVEEWTGTWCGWCPRGIVGMHKMEEKYGDQNFIGIAVHSNDAMQVSSYNAFVNYYSGGSFPGCIINRNPAYSGVDPSFENLEACYDYFVAIPAYGKVDLTIGYDWTKPEEIAVETTTVFDINSPKADYRLAFVVTENHYGPYTQENYFSPQSGYPPQTLEGWDTEKPKVVTYFDHTARSITSVWGIEESIPSNVTKGEPYTFSTAIKTSGVRDITQCEVVALILDNSDRQIINAAKVKLTDASKVEGIEGGSLSITATKGAVIVNGDYETACIYAIDGKEAARGNGESTIGVPAGIYIVRATAADGSVTTRKLAVK